MTSYTLQLKKVIELTGATVDIVNGIRVIEGGNIGLHAYPIFDTNYRQVLNGKIIDHYWNREIGLETIDMFQLAMRRKMNEVMPYYNQLYNSTKINYDALSTVDIRTIAASDSINTTTNEGNSEATTTNTSGSRAVTFDTPQTQLSGNEDYASGGSDVHSNATGSNVNTEQSAISSNTENTGDTHITGFQGAAADLIMRFRESLINVDMMVITELEDCFMQVYDTGESFTKGYYL